MNESKQSPIASASLRDVVSKLPTPFYIYDERGIRENARLLQKAFAWCPSFKEYFAVKATPNPHILALLKEEGVGADCSSMAELMLAEAVGLGGREVMFTSNNTPANEYQKALELGALLNLDDLSHLDYLAQHCGVPETICFRYNPGPLREGNAIIGSPEQAKYGLTRPQIFEAYAQAAALGAKHFGLHTMVASNELNPDFFVDTARMLFELAIELSEAGIRISFINLGGGIGIPYKPEDTAIDLVALGESIREVYQEMIVPAGLDPLAVCMENGRMMTGPFGVLVTEAIHFKHIYKEYVGVDASMANLMRPGMYEAYHHISVLGKEDAPADTVVDVVGSLCENNDKFAIDRALPKIERGDILLIHDAGAHGHAMGFQYNGKLRCAEYLYREDGSLQEIRRAETHDDYFATLNFPGL